MSYSDGEAAILELLRDMAQFDRLNSSRANWRILNSGASDHFAVIRQGPSVLDYDTLGQGHVTATYRTVIELWQRYGDDGPSAEALQELVAAVVEYVEQYQDLSGTAQLAWPESIGEMQEAWRKDGGPVWLRQEVTIVWQEERLVA